MNPGAVFEGKVVLVGLCYFNKAGALLRQEQKHGAIVRVGEDGIELRLSEGGSLLLPPFVSSLQPAPKGTYTESWSGKSVKDPDFLANYYLHDEGGPPGKWLWRPAPTFRFPAQGETKDAKKRSDACVD